MTIDLFGIKNIYHQSVLTIGYHLLQTNNHSKILNISLLVKLSHHVKSRQLTLNHVKSRQITSIHVKSRQLTLIDVKKKLTSISVN